MSTRAARSLLLPLLLLACLLSIAVQAEPADTDPAATSSQRADVLIDGQHLFTVSGFSAFPAQKRAETIAGRIRVLAANPAYRSGSLTIAALDSYSRIEFQGQLIMNVTEADANAEGVGRALMANLIVARIDESIRSYRDARTTQAITRATLVSLAWTVAFLVGLALFLWLYRRIASALVARLEASAAKHSARTAGVVHAEQLIHALLGMLGMIRGVIIAVSLLGFVSLVLAQFPWTRSLSGRIFDLVLGPLHTMWNAFTAAIPNLVFVFVLIVLIRWVLKIIRLFFSAIGRSAIVISSFEPEWAEPTFRIVRILVIAFGTVVAYPYLPGSGSEAFKGVSLFIGVIFSLGSTGFISNMMAGYSLTYRRVFKVGDRVKIGDSIGDVEYVRLQVTHLRSLKNEEIIIPNSVIVNSEVVNYSSLARKHALILHTTVGIGYETPWRQVEAMLLESAARTHGLAAEPPPFVMQKTLGDFCVTYELNVFCSEPARQMQYYTELHRNILDVFNEYGVQIMTPAYEGDPAEPKVVPKEKWFDSPARRGPTA